MYTINKRELNYLITLNELVKACGYNNYFDYKHINELKDDVSSGLITKEDIEYSLSEKCFRLNTKEYPYYTFCYTWGIGSLSERALYENLKEYEPEFYEFLNNKLTIKI